VLVNNGGDLSVGGDDVCTLREAVDTVNSESDTGNGCTLLDDGSSSYAINFSVGTVTLTQGQIDIVQSVKIDAGARAAPVTIQQTTDNRILDIDSIISPSPQPGRSFEFINLRFIDGRSTLEPSTNSGGAIRISLENTSTFHTVKIKDCYFEDNKALSGGALFVASRFAGQDLRVEIADTVFQNNESERAVRPAGGFSYGSGGAAFFIEIKELIISNVQFIGNSSNEGGALSIQDSETTITGSTFDQNTASNVGALSQSGGSFLIQNITFSNNISELPSDGGPGQGNFGAISGQSLDATIEDSEIVNNSAAGNVGGASCCGSDTNFSFILNNVTVAGNSAQGTVGGVSGRSLQVNNSRFIGNSAVGSAGGLAITFGGINGFSEVKDSTFTGNTVIAPPNPQSTFDAGIGGGIYADGPDHVFSGLTLNDNSAVNGGGMVMFVSANENTLSNSTFSNSVASDRGGGIYIVDASSSTLNNTTFFANRAGIVGGGMYLERASNIAVKNSITANSSAEQFPAGSDCSALGDPPLFTNSLVEDASCDALNRGGIDGDAHLDSVLKDNGGPTKTHVLLNGSIAKDTADNASSETSDQRGMPRPDPQTGQCDMGAFDLAVHSLLYQTQTVQQL